MGGKYVKLFIKTTYTEHAEECICIMYYILPPHQSLFYVPLSLLVQYEWSFPFFDTSRCAQAEVVENLLQE